MKTHPDTHPSPGMLQAFGLGKLDDASADTVLGHLETCSDCRKEVIACGGDSFLDRLRQAHHPGNTPAPDDSMLDLPRNVAAAGSDRTTAYVSCNVPPELASHPQYEILRELGRGGMGVVYLARHRLSGRQEALKVMNKEFLARPGSKERFLREIQSAAALDHPNVVKMYTAMELGDSMVLVTEYVAGEDLAKLVKEQGPLPLLDACHYVQQAALGLQHAFERKMVHRDIKPQNLILARQGENHVIKVLDFGLAKVIRETDGDSSLTGLGKMLGTPDYVAPEQTLDATSADTRSDIYSLGCTLYFLLTGHAPFRAKSQYEILHAHQTMQARSLDLERPEVPAELAAVVARMMEKEPAKRYRRPIEAAEALMAFIKSPADFPSRELPLAEAESAKSVERRPESIDIVTQARQEPGSKAARPRTGKTKTAGTTAIQPVHSRRGGSGKKRPPWPWLVGMAGGCFAAAIAGIVLLWPTPHGMVRIESDDPNVEIVFDKAGPTVKAAGMEPITLRAGEHGALIRVKRGEFEFETSKFLLKKGATTTLRLEFLPDKVQVKADGEVIGAEPLPPPIPPSPQPNVFTNGMGMEFVLVPKGKSWLGGRAGRSAEKEVVIARDFYLGKYEVTQEEWEKVTGLTPSFFSRTGSGKDMVVSIADTELKRFPVEMVSWDDTRAFLERLNGLEKQPGWVYRLPTEAEWEYACRGGPLADKFDCAYDFYFDKPTNQLSLEQANFGDSKGLKRPCRVGSYKPNRLGLYDMHANAQEWCDDGDKGADGTSLRVSRGGGWFDEFAGNCAAASRRLNEPSYVGSGIGLRVARVAVGKNP
jgi:serine/threonine protein kinase/formylglycine-generating enzyme required for sulfatase activity